MRVIKWCKYIEFEKLYLFLYQHKDQYYRLVPVQHHPHILLLRQSGQGWCRFWIWSGYLHHISPNSLTTLRIRPNLLHMQIENNRFFCIYQASQSLIDTSIIDISIWDILTVDWLSIMPGIISAFFTEHFIFAHNFLRNYDDIWD